MKAKELKAAVAAGKIDKWTVSRLNKTPMTNRQRESLYVLIECLGRVETTDIIRATDFKPQDHHMTLHFCGVSCPLDGELVWEAFLDSATALNRKIEIAEGVRHYNT